MRAAILKAYNSDLVIETRKRTPRVAFDGEKMRMRAPLRFRIEPQALSIICPAPQDRVKV